MTFLIHRISWSVITMRGPTSTRKFLSLSYNVKRWSKRFYCKENSDLDTSTAYSHSEFENICVCDSCDSNETKCQSRLSLCSKVTDVHELISWRSKLAWGFVFGVMTCFFLAAAYVQHNDPDPYLWMPAYVVPSLVNMSVIAFSICPSKFNPWNAINWIITIHIAYCYTLGFWTLTHYLHRQLLDSFDNLESVVNEPHMEMEEAKELIGLCLIIAWLSLVSNQNYLKFGQKGIIFGSLLTSLPIVSWVLVEKFEEQTEAACL